MYGFLVLLARGQEEVIDPDDEEQAQRWLVHHNAEAQIEYYKALNAAWNYNTDLTDENLNASVSTNCERLTGQYASVLQIQLLCLVIVLCLA